MINGTVKRFIDLKGFGFIGPVESVHHSAINSIARKFPIEGACETADIEQGATPAADNMTAA